VSSKCAKEEQQNSEKGLVMSCLINNGNYWELGSGCQREVCKAPLQCGMLWLVALQRVDVVRLNSVVPQHCYALL
jgi:hypothetical protein